ncbi:CHAT domain-containing tetratricopeptide repeat protein [Streptomyces spongiicola]|uniref:CHAT domain-containing protein n=1 Tax=Streptomyces spongiicola TaxID=1690221 RepID=UPI00340E5039
MGWAEQMREAEHRLEEGDLDEAIDRFGAALREGDLQSAGVDQETDIRRSLARLHKTRDDYPKARAALDTALSRLRSHPRAVRAEALVLVDLASLQREWGYNIEAERTLSRVPAGSGSLDDEVLAALHVERGIVRKDLGRLSDARGDLEEGLRLARRARLTGLAGHARTGLGLLAVLLNDLKGAERHYRAARRAYRSIPDAENESIIWHNLGVLYDKQDRPADALRCYRKALEMDAALGSEVGVAENLSATASLLQARGRAADARALHLRALELYTGVEHKQGAVTALVNLAIVARQSGEPVEEHLRAALRLAEEVGNPRDVADVRFVWGDCHLVDGRTDDAFAHYLEAARAQSGMRSMLSEREALSYFDESRGDEVLDRLVRLSADAGDTRRALMCAEAAKGRELIRRLAGAPGPDGTDRRLRSPDPELALFTADEGAWFEQVTALLQHHGSGGRPCHLVEFHLAEKTAVVFVLTAHDTEPIAVPVSTDRALLRDVTRRWAGNGAVRGDRREEWLQLTVPLLEPLADRIPPGERIVLVPHDALHRVPLHAVPLQGTPLGIRNPVTYAPSITVLEHIRQRAHHTGDALVIDTSGHSGDLVFASEQALSVTETLTGAGHRVTALPAANTARRPPGRREVLGALRSVDGPRILHIAGHGRFDPQDPMRSGIPLGERSLTARDLAELRLRCELVTVGTCESGVVDRHPGDELLGLARALVIAGADALLLSLWEVDQLSTGMLLRHFYGAWLTDGEPKAQALRTAQRALRDSTAHDARRYAQTARERSTIDPHAEAAIKLAEAKVCLAARDHTAAHALAADADGSHTLSDSERLDAERVQRMARLGSLDESEPDYDRRLYDDMRHWAAFVLVGLGG